MWEMLSPRSIIMGTLLCSQTKLQYVLNSMGYRHCIQHFTAIFSLTESAMEVSNETSNADVSVALIREDYEATQIYILSSPL